MDASKVHSRLDTLANPASSQRSKNVESNEPSIETLPNNDQEGGLQASKETVRLSDASLKLSTSSPVKSSDQTASIESKDQAQQVLSQLIADIQSNPAQAQGAHSNIFDGAVKSLLG